MNRKVTVSLIMLFMLAFNSSGAVFAQGTSNKEKVDMKSTWLWRTDQVVDHQEEIISFLVNQNVNLLYLQVNKDIPIDVYKSFIKDAHHKGIDVYALGGSPKWVDSYVGLHQFFDWIRYYQKNASKQEQFKGVQLDIEPYLTNGWKSHYQYTVYKYQKALMISKYQTKAMKLPLEAAIPFWFDGQEYTNSVYGTGKLSDWVTRKVDRIAIMAYRNQLEGKNGIVELTKHEVSFANKKKKYVTVAVETKEHEGQDFITFFNEGTDELNNTIVKLDEIYRKYDYFWGTGIHSYTYWNSLIEK